MSDADFRPTANWETLKLRAAMLQRLRDFFAERGFLEVDTPLLSRDTVIDVHLEPLAVDLCDRRRLYLQTSPEFAMKRLLAAGAAAIYQITRAFRDEEVGDRHNIEFTIAEWYQAGQSMSEAMQLLSDLGEHLLGLGAAKRLTFAEAFQRHAGVDPHAASCDDLIASAREHGLLHENRPPHRQRDVWLAQLLTQLVEPQPGIAGPTILYDCPADQAALATVRPGPPAVAERFELYVRGIELANGYHELRDASELRERNRVNNLQRRDAGRRVLPEDSRLLDAMEHGLPQCCGVALGFDRLVMIAAGATTLDEVMAFPFPIA